LADFVASFRTRFAKTPEAGAFAGFLVVFLFFAFAAPDTFLSNNAFSSILNSQAVPGIVAIGITLLMISGEFDLSVGSILGVSSLVFLYATVSGAHVLIAGVLGLLAGCLLGLLNGLLLIWTGIPSFIVTLGTMVVYRAISLSANSGGRIIRYSEFSSQGPTISPPVWAVVPILFFLMCLFCWMIKDTAEFYRYRPKKSTAATLGLQLLGLLALTWTLWCVLSSDPSPIDVFRVLNGPLAFIPGNYRAGILWWFFLTALFTILLTRTRFGNAIFATGGHAQAARLQGINIDRVRVTNFVISGGLAAVAGIIQTARLKSVDPLRGTGMELEVIASVVIGGTLLSGGFGGLIGSAIGTVLTGMLGTGLVLIQVPSNAFRGAIGAIMIIAVIINNFVRRERSLPCCNFGAPGENSATSWP
jgi:ribose/xylose/arabinose/galactoside ABC-type transport system permease subunit